MLDFGVAGALAWPSRVSGKSKHCVSSAVPQFPATAALPCPLETSWTLDTAYLPGAPNSTRPGWSPHPSSLSSNFPILGLPALEGCHPVYGRRFMWCCFLNTNDHHVYYVSLHVSYIYTNLSMSTRKLGSSLFCVIVSVSLLKEMITEGSSNLKVSECEDMCPHG